MAQADQQIQNDNWQSVRADLNNNFDALFSNNSGIAEPSTTAFMWWADTNNDELKIRNAADNAFITVGTLSETNSGYQQQGALRLLATSLYPLERSAACRFVLAETPIPGLQKRCQRFQHCHWWNSSRSL